MFVTEGPVDPQSPLFVGRDAELKQMEAWLISVRSVGAVMGARQTGKTSLLLRLRHLLRDKYAFVFIDLEAVAGAGLSECVSYIASEMIDQLTEQVGPLKLNLPQTSNEFLLFLGNCSRAVSSVRIVLLLDEVGALLPDTSFRLSSAIRSVFTTRFVKPEFGRYVFVLAGAMDILDLATGNNSPLKNVTETLYVGDLSISETQRLVAEMFGETSSASCANLSEVLHGWTSGHPYWTQRLGETVHLRTTGVDETSVGGAVEQLLLTEDRNLPHVFKALAADRTLTDIMTALVGGTPIGFTRANETIARLELLGLLKNVRGRCVIRNQIYRRALEHQPIHRFHSVSRDMLDLTERLLDADDKDTLLQAAAIYLQGLLQNRSVAVFAPQGIEGTFAAVSSVGLELEDLTRLRLTNVGPLVKTLTTAVDPGTIALSEGDAACFERLDTALVVPIRTKEALKAFFSVGRKLSGDAFDDEDRQYLAAVAEQTAACLDRLRLRLLQRDAIEAWEIQKKLLPEELPEISGFQFAGSCRPVREVGGDYYDAFKVTDHTIALCVGDVVGKGVPAALLMSSLQSAVKVLCSETMRPGVLCQRINELIAQHIPPGKFITFFYALVDTATRELVYTNAGHNPPILLHATGEVIRLGEGGPPLGVFTPQTYADTRLMLQPGDKVLLFTDGVTEAFNTDGEEFGDDRLVALVRTSLDAAALEQSVVDAVTRFSNGNFHDDVTVLALIC
jgi:serine phosphatase RsbU (regulator of sigma subunit)